MTRPQPFITSVRVEPSDGPHEYVSVWIRGANVGTLCVGKSDGEQLRRLLLSETVFPSVKAWQDADCPGWPARVAGEPLVDELEPAPEIAARIMRSLDDESREVLAELVLSWPQQDHTKAEAERGSPAPSLPAAKELESGSRPAPARELPAAGGPISLIPIGPERLSPDDPRVRAQRRLGLAIDASFRADEREMLRRSGWQPPMVVVVVDEDRAREAADAWREEETIG